MSTEWGVRYSSNQCVALCDGEADARRFLSWLQARHGENVGEVVHRDSGESVAPEEGRWP